MNDPYGVALDSQGDLFIADIATETVREVNAATGIITTVAGIPNQSGSTGDHGPATSALLNAPAGVAVDANGDIFIADAGNDVIREVNGSTHKITTIAGVLGQPGTSGDGGAATAAKLNDPTGLVLDGQGDLFIADTQNDAIRELNLSTHVLTTVAGTLGHGGAVGDGGAAISAKLSDPQAVALDSAGDLFIADTSNDVIREVNSSTHNISTVAGAIGQPGSTGDGGAATSARLYQPSGVALDGAGDLFIADAGNDAIRKVSPTGVITTYAGQLRQFNNTGNNVPATSAKLENPFGLAVDANGDLFIADLSASDVRRVTPAPSISNVQPSGGTVQGGGTTSITWNSGGVSGNVDILLSTNGGGTFTPIASNVPNAGVYAWSVPADLSTSTAEIRVVDHIYASATGTSAATFTISLPTVPIISTVAGVAGQRNYSGDGGPAVAAALNDPSGEAVDAQGNLFIADNENNVVREVNALTGVITTVAGIPGQSGYSGDGGQATAAMLESPNDVAVDNHGNLFIADNGVDVIREVNLSTGIITTVAGVAYNSDSSGDGGQATSAEIGSPYGVAVDGQGHLFIADDENAVVREVNLSTGKISTVAGTGTEGLSGNGGPATSAMLDSPVYLAVDGQGHLFIADSGNHDIREVNLSTGIISTVAGNGTSGSSGDGGQATSAELSNPQGVAVDGQGNLYIADTSNQVIRIVNLAKGVISTYAGIAPHSGSSGDNGPATAARLSQPEGLAVDSQGDLFIADAFNDLIRRVTPVASISNVQPSGGAVQGGGTTEITWSSTQITGGVDILLSTNGGSTFSTTIASNVPNFGVYAWSVPADLSTATAEIEVAAHGSTSVSSTSAATFTISQPTVAIISTVAGTGTRGLSGDSGPAILATFNEPASVAVDGKGNLFIDDSQDDTIREVNAATGVITIVAGVPGQHGATGDGGPATSALLSFPEGVALDGKGNLFIADANNNEIREVNLATGVITTVAGNGTGGFSGDGMQATSAELSNPDGVAVDAQGHLFIADQGNNRIREVNLSTGIITTVAGNGTAGSTGDGAAATAAELNAPQGLAVDSHGNLFIADVENQKIREVNASSGNISTVAGNGTFGSTGDGSAATAAEVSFPLGVAVDAKGDLFIADHGNDSIREVNVAGVITTVAGDGASGSSGDNGPATSAELFAPDAVAVDGQGDLFIADTFNHVIRRVTPVPSITNVLPASGTLQGGGNTVITWSSMGVTTVDVLLSTNGGATFPYTIAANLPSSGSFTWNVPDAEGTTTAEIRVVDHIDANVKGTGAGTFTITPSAVPIISTFAGSSTGSSGYSGDGGLAVSALLASPVAVAVDSQGDLFIAEQDNDIIRKVNAFTGVITTVAGNGGFGSSGDGGLATNAELMAPQGVAVDNQGDLFIADSDDNRIREVNAATGVITTVAGNGTRGSTGDNGLATNAELFFPQGLAVDGQGNLFIADNGNNEVREVNLSTGVITTIAGGGTAGLGDNGPATAATLNQPDALAVDGQGHLFIADSGNNRIREVTFATGVITTVAGNGTEGTSGDGGQAASAELSEPEGVAVDGQGNLFISSNNTNVIREVDPTGKITTYAGALNQNGTTGDNGPANSAKLSNPAGLAVDGQGNLFIADDSNNEIRRISTPAGPGGAIVTDTPLIAWQTLEGGVSEDLAIVDDSTGQTLPVVSNLTGLAYQLTAAQALPRGHTFTWYIGAVSSGGGISWSGGTNFSVPALGAPTPSGPSGPIMPSAGYDTPTFSWSSVNGAAMYDLDLKDLSTGMTVFNNTNVSGTTYTPSSPLLVGHSFTWYVGTEGAAAPPAAFPGASPRASRSTR